MKNICEYCYKRYILSAKKGIARGCAASNAVKYTRLLFFNEYGHKRRQARENAEYARENSAVGEG